MRTSLFDLFKIGIGPSSSHTVGPMKAAYRYASRVKDPNARITVELYGSLALTGKGHGTDRAIMLGLAGHEPDTVDPNLPTPVNPNHEIVWHTTQTLSGHSNGMRFSSPGVPTAVFYSVGGGFITEENERRTSNVELRTEVPYPFRSAAELLAQCAKANLSIADLVLKNECAWRPESEVRAHIARVWQTMQDCTRRGLETEGTLPGGLNVRRRAPGLMRKLLQSHLPDPLRSMDWLNVFAIAVNEENASGGRVVTAPTNGAAGIIPAVAHYYMRFMDGTPEGIEHYFLAASAIGVLYKENASISGAEVGCQGEVGVACSMAAAGLAAALGGTNEQIEHAAEIGMEHNLGMTCDPIGGLVQIPCIERNAFGAVKAVNAARMSLQETDGHKVTLDQVIKTMYETGLDMQTRYKETSLGGLALNVIEC